MSVKRRRFILPRVLMLYRHISHVENTVAGVVIHQDFLLLRVNDRVNADRAKTFQGLR